MELSLFPQGALSSSVITTVWVGVAVIAFLNLRFGTTLSGLVIPGYLVPLLLLRPVSALVIVGEGLLTFLLGYLLAEKLPKWLRYAEFFGRDRFFALVLISVAVRLVMDGFCLPWLGEQLWNHGLQFDYRNNLHSFGLIIVALIANQMWNGGMAKGMASLVTYTLITYGIVLYILIPFTNFNISSMNYMYEELATSILASPKAYIILLTSAFIASRLNLQYGWEFNGILIPSLLALQWYQPGKLVITFVEAFLIYFIAIGMLRIPWLKGMNMEGARQILLFFNISFVYKIAVGYLILAVAPEIKISDFFAFGYLLSTLIALKMYQKDIAVRMTRATIQTSFVAVVMASIIGYALTFLPFGQASSALEAEQSRSAMPVVNQDLLSFITERRSQLFASSESSLSGQANPVELDTLNQAFQHLAKYLDRGDPSQLALARSLYLKLEMQLTRVEDYLVLYEQDSQRGWGLYVFNLQPESTLVIQVPAPLDELQSVDVALQMFLHTSAKALAMPGMRRKQASDGSSDILLNPQSPFQLFHRQFALDSALQVRQFNNQSRRELLGIPSTGVGAEEWPETNQLWLKGSVPTGLNLRLLQEVLPDLEIHWSENPLVNRQREQSLRDFAELYLSGEGLRAMLAFGGFQQSLSEQQEQRRIDGYLLSAIKEDKAYLARRGSETYRQPQPFELLYFDQAVLMPLIQELETALAEGWSEPTQLELSRLNRLAAAMNYQLTRYRHLGSSDNYLILSERLNAKRHHGGTFVFRVGPARPFVVEVARPLAERNTLEFGVALFENMQARALLIAGSHPLANYDGSADVLSKQHGSSFFNSVHQVLLRESDVAPGAVIQLRAMSLERAEIAQQDVIVSKMVEDEYVEDSLTGELLDKLETYGLRAQFADGSFSTRGYEVSWNAQASYMPMTDNKQFYTLWLAPEIRKQYQDKGEDASETIKFKALGVMSYEEDVPKWLVAEYPSLSGGALSDRVKLNGYLQNGNILSLSQFLDSNPELLAQRLVDKNTKQEFLLLTYAGQFVAMVNLDTFNEQSWQAEGDLTLQRLRDFVDSRARWLWGGSR